MISESFQKLKSNLELHSTFQDTIQQKHNAVRSVIENLKPGTQTKLIGSLQRQTRIQPKPGDTFDIDILVIPGEFTRWATPFESGFKPEAAIQNLHDIVKSSSRYGAMQPQQDQPTVTFEYQNHIKVELVPGYVDMIGHSSDGSINYPKGRGYWVPKNGAWEYADYDYDAEHVTAHNKNTNGWFIPTVKMLKAIRRLHFPDMSPYHLEIIATHVLPPIFQTYKEQGWQLSYPDVITGFFNTAEPYLDVGGIRMNGSLTPHVSFELQHKPKILKTFDDIKQHVQAIPNLNSEGAKKNAWRILFGDVFPS